MIYILLDVQQNPLLVTLYTFLNLGKLDLLQGKVLLHLFFLELNLILADKNLHPLSDGIITEVADIVFIFHFIRIWIRVPEHESRLRLRIKFLRQFIISIYEGKLNNFYNAYKKSC